ncbi:MAG: hypothetical protein ABSF84_14145 [Acidimicrobiales bacterium]
MPSSASPGTSDATAASATIGSTPRIWDTRTLSNPASAALRASVRTSSTPVRPVPAP